VRSLTKFYGMPALRVGYSVSTPERAAQIEAHLPAWPVTTLAASAAVEAVKDERYARETLRAATEDRQRLRDRLVAIGLDACPSAGNFLLLHLAEAALDSTAMRETLIRRHRIIVRDCRSFDGLEDGRFIRVAVRSCADNERLVDAIDAVLREGR
jgi:threonine-phosphate decarboxylase